jgi:hypothetical protein
MEVRFLTPKEKEMIRVALDMRINYIETGSVTCGAATIAKFNNPERAKREFGAQIKALSEEQMELILETRKFERKLFEDDIIVREK